MSKKFQAGIGMILSLAGMVSTFFGVMGLLHSILNFYQDRNWWNVASIALAMISVVGLEVISPLASVVCVLISGYQAYTAFRR